jgi:hypothetical protein
MYAIQARIDTISIIKLKIDENPTVIEFSSEALRSIDIAMSIINSKAKFNKETKRFTLSEFIAYERKKKIKKKIDEKSRKSKMAQYYTITRKFNYNYTIKLRFSRIKLQKSQLTQYRA